MCHHLGDDDSSVAGCYTVVKKETAQVRHFASTTVVLIFLKADTYTVKNMHP